MTPSLLGGISLDWLPWRGQLPELARLPLTWAIVTGLISVWLLLPGSTPRRRQIASLLGVISIGCWLAASPSLASLTAQAVFWFMAAVTFVAAVQTICVRNPVYSAIWFALALLGTAGIFLFQGAEFLSVATIVVYAGAIVVTFLFVVMLAQPDGHAAYDRITWSGFAKPLAVLAAGLLVGVTTFAIARLPDEPTLVAGNQGGAQQVLAPAHMALLGTELFGKHLIAVELAGTLLLVALAGAVVLVMQDRQGEQDKRGEEAARDE